MKNINTLILLVIGISLLLSWRQVEGQALPNATVIQQVATINASSFLIKNNTQSYAGSRIVICEGEGLIDLGSTTIQFSQLRSRAIGKISQLGRWQWVILFPANTYANTTAADTLTGDFYITINNYQPAIRWQGLLIPNGTSIIKLNCQGQGIWVRAMPPSVFVPGTLLVSGSRLYYAGAFNNTITVAPGVSYSSGGPNRSCGFIMCLDTAGSYRWSRPFTSTFQPPTSGFNSGGLDYIYKLPGIEQYHATYTAQRNYSFGNLAIPNDSRGMVRFDSTGNIIKFISYSTELAGVFYSTKADGQGNILLTGQAIQPGVSIADTIFQSPNSSAYNIFFLMLDTAGKRKYAFQVNAGATNTLTNVDLDVRGNALISFFWSKDSAAYIYGRRLRDANSAIFSSSPALMTIAPSGEIVALYDTVSQSYGGLISFWLGRDNIAGTLRLLQNNTPYFAGSRLNQGTYFCVLGTLVCPRPTPSRSISSGANQLEPSTCASCMPLM